MIIALESGYKVLGWKESQFLEKCKIIINSCGDTIQMIELDSGDTIYLVPEAFYLEAKRKLK